MTAVVSSLALIGIYIRQSVGVSQPATQIKKKLFLTLFRPLKKCHDLSRQNTRKSKSSETYFHETKSRNTLAIMKRHRNLIKLSRIKLGLIWHDKSKEIAFIAGAPYALYATCTGGTSTEGRRRRTATSCLLCHELKGFYVVRMKKKGTTPYGPIISGAGYRVSCVLRRSKTGMTSRNRPAKTKGPIDTNCAG